MTPTNPDKVPAADVLRQWTPGMRHALRQAELSLDTGDVPVGAVVLDSQGKIQGTGHNEREARSDPTAHAEVLAIRQAGNALGRWRLDDCTLVVSLEPCPMCAGAIRLARLARVVFGSWDHKAGACGSLYDIARDAALGEVPEVIGGVMKNECSALLTAFFREKRRA